MIVVRMSRTFSILTEIEPKLAQGKVKLNSQTT